MRIGLHDRIPAAEILIKHGMGVEHVETVMIIFCHVPAVDVLVKLALLGRASPRKKRVHVNDLADIPRVEGLVEGFGVLEHVACPVSSE